MNLIEDGQTRYKEANREEVRDQFEQRRAEIKTCYRDKMVKTGPLHRTLLSVWMRLEVSWVRLEDSTKNLYITSE